jgi:hypothetical protein
MPYGIASTVNVLSNDDFRPAATISISKIGGTASGIVSFNPLTGIMSYTPTASEPGRILLYFTKYVIQQ